MKLRPHCHTAIFTVPTFVSAGAVSSGTTSTTPGLPAGQQANDILIFMASWNDVGGNITTPTGYTSIAVKNGSESRIRVFWKRSVGGGEAAQTATVSLGTAGIIGRMLAFRSCITVGSPFDQAVTSEDATHATALTCPALTANFPNSMVVNMVGLSLLSTGSTNTTEFSGWTNANLASITEATDNDSNTGTGMGLGSAYGILAGTGSSGSTTLTGVTSANHVFITFNLIGVQT